MFVDAVGSSAGVRCHVSVGLAPGDTSVLPEACKSLSQVDPTAQPGDVLTLVLEAGQGLVPRATHFVTLRVVDGLGQQSTLVGSFVHVVSPPVVAPDVVPRCALVPVSGPVPTDAAAACVQALGVAPAGTTHAAVPEPESGGSAGGVALLGCWNGTALGMVDPVSPEPLGVAMQVQVQGPEGDWVAVSAWQTMGDVSGGVAAMGVAGGEGGDALGAGVYRVVLRGTNTAMLSREVACPYQAALGTWKSGLGGLGVGWGGGLAVSGSGDGRVRVVGL